LYGTALEVQGRWLALVALPVGIAIFRGVSGAFGADAAAMAAEGGETAMSELTRYGGVFGAYGAVLSSHLFCCWKAADVLRFDALNRHRLTRAAEEYVRGGREAVLSVEDAGEREGVYRARVTASTPTLGASVEDAARDWDDLLRFAKASEANAPRLGGARAMNDDDDEDEDDDDDDARGVGVLRRRFVIGWDARRRVPAVMLDAAATPRDIIEAALAAARAGAATTAATDAAATDAAAAEAYRYADENVDAFSDAMEEKGWKIDFVQMGSAPRYRLGGLS
jgi:hypothetical protein